MRRDCCGYSSFVGAAVVVVTRSEQLGSSLCDVVASKHGSRKRFERFWMGDDDGLDAL